MTRIKFPSGEPGWRNAPGALYGLPRCARNDNSWGISVCVIANEVKQSSKGLCGAMGPAWYHPRNLSILWGLGVGVVVFVEFVVARGPFLLPHCPAYSGNGRHAGGKISQCVEFTGTLHTKP